MTTDDVLYLYRERVAMMELDGGKTIKEAQWDAYWDLRNNVKIPRELFSPEVMEIVKLANPGEDDDASW